MYTDPLNIQYATSAASKLGYQVEMMDSFSHYLIKISSKSDFVFVGSGKVHGYALNNSTIATVATDKSHTYDLLAGLGIRIPVSQLVFINERFADLRPPGREMEDAKAFAAGLGYPVFVKPNDGSRGVLAQSVASESELEEHLLAIGQYFSSALVQERLVGSEGRIFYIDGEPWFAYSKTKPEIETDGVRSIGEILSSEDRKLLRKGLSAVNRRDPILMQSLQNHKLELASIAPAGLKIAFSEKANVSGGGGVVDFREIFTEAERCLCRTVYDSTGLRVCAIDTLITHDELAPVVLELNANPSLSSLEKLGKTDLLLKIWETILRKSLGDRDV